MVGVKVNVVNKTFPASYHFAISPFPHTALNVTCSPSHTMPLLTVAVDGADGTWFTITTTEVFTVHPLPFLTVTMYVPALAKVALAIDGFCSVEVNAGPLHENVPLPSDFKLIVSVSQTVAPVADTVGKAFTVTDTVAVVVASQELFDTTVTV